MELRPRAPCAPSLAMGERVSRAGPQCPLLRTNTDLFLLLAVPSLPSLHLGGQGKRDKSTVFKGSPWTSRTSPPQWGQGMG